MPRRSLGLHVGRERGPPVAFVPNLGEPDGHRPGRAGGEQGGEDDDDGEGGRRRRMRSLCHCVPAPVLARKV